VNGLGLRARLLLLALLPVAGLAALLSAYATYSRVHDLELAAREQGLAVARGLAMASALDALADRPEALVELAHRAAAAPRIRGVAVLSAGGRPVAEAGTVDWNGLDRGALPGRPRVLQAVGSDALTVWHPLANAGGVVVSLSSEHTRAHQRLALLHSVGLSVASLLMAAVFALRLGDQVSQPVARLKQAVERIQAGHRAVRLRPRSSGELGALEAGVEAMADALQRGREDMQTRVRVATAELRSLLEQVRLQNAELEAAQDRALSASRAKSAFLANVGHELRTPISGVLGSSELLAKTALDAPQREHVATIRESASQLREVIDAILDYSKMEADDLHLESVPFDPRDGLEEVMAEVAGRAFAAGLELVGLVYDDVPRALEGDPGRLRQVLLALVDNAVKFTPSGEVIVRVMRDDDHEPEHVPAPGSAVRLRFSVSDTGIGIPPEHQDTLFAPFSQVDDSASRAYGGAGLGLAIARRLVERMGGQIGVESAPGEGSQLWFTADFRLAQHPPPVAPLDLTPPGALAGRRVLLHDPHPYGRLAIRHLLERWEMTVSELGTPEAWHAPEGRGADLVVLGLAAADLAGQGPPPALARALERFAAPVGVLAPSVEPAALEALVAWGAAFALPKTAPRHLLRRTLLGVMETGSVPAPAWQAPAGMRVLIAEDNAVNRRVLLALLTDMGVDAEAVENGAKAVTRAATGRFDLIIMDLQMPVLDGLQAAAHIRRQESLRGLPIVALTASASPSQMRLGAEDGNFDALLTKPVSQKRLAEVLTRLAGPGNGRLPIHDHGEAVRLAGGNAGLAGELLEMLRRELTQRRADLRRTFEAGDWETLKMQVHKLHGGTAYCGVPALRQAAASLDASLPSGEPQRVARLFEAFEAESQRLLSLDLSAD
jgi:two-component system sensor histidine kinase BarA